MALDTERHEELCALRSFMCKNGYTDQGEHAQEPSPHNTLEQHLTTPGETMDGFKRMEKCRMGLDALDRSGWKRSYFQRKFHDAFLAACARIFFKLDPPGSFQRAYQRILEINNWDNLSQEILISTPRRFGKTISVSLFSAALLFSCSAVELSVYSTCKRISQKLLRNIVRFLNQIYTTLGVPALTVLRANCEEIHIQGPEGPADVRIANSYPSKVCTHPLPLTREPCSVPGQGFLPPLPQAAHYDSNPRKPSTRSSHQ